ncbi:MAG: hypothetical protein ABL949_06370 [Fimbriimonadaceae bacterium]
MILQTSAQCAFEGLLDGPTNMAHDLALLERDGVAWRVYGWDGPWVSLGRFQTAETALLPGAPVKWVQRPTGGRAVLHGHDITVGLAAPIREDLRRSIKTVYTMVIAPILASLRACGIPACMGAERAAVTRDSSDCFSRVSPNDIISQATGHKVCGCALQVVAAKVLLQCSIPVGLPLVDPKLVYGEPARTSHVTIELDEFVAALALACQRLFDNPVIVTGQYR